MRKALLGIGAAVAFVWGAWFFALPVSLLESVIEDRLNTGAVEVDFIDMKKGMFLSFAARSVVFRASGWEIASVEDARAGLDPSGVLGLKARVPFEGALGGGLIRGAAHRGADGLGLDVQVTGAQLAGLGFLRSAGIKGKGMLSAEAHVLNSGGSMKFAVSDMEIERVPYFGGSLPLHLLDGARGVVSFSGKSIDVESIGLQGKGLYARIKGTVKGNKIDMSIELMPDDDTVLDPLAVALIDRYKVQPGYYVIPIRGDARQLLSGRGT